MILATYFPITPPMRMPDYAWAMVVLAADMVTTDRPGTHGDDDPASRVHLFAGCWTTVRLDPTANTGDVILRLHPPAPTPYTDPDRVDIDMLLAQQGRWDRVGAWHGMGTGWPGIVAPTAHLSMRLRGDADQFDPCTDRHRKRSRTQDCHLHATGEHVRWPLCRQWACCP